MAKIYQTHHKRDKDGFPLKVHIIQDLGEALSSPTIYKYFIEYWNGTLEEITQEQFDQMEEV